MSIASERQAIQETLGLKLKEAGKNKVESHNPTFLEWARDTAKRLSLSASAGIDPISAKLVGCPVCTDDLRGEYEFLMDDVDNPMRPPAFKHHNVWGAVFRGDDWEFVDYVVSTRPAAHGRVIRRWRYVG